MTFQKPIYQQQHNYQAQVLQQPPPSNGQGGNNYPPQYQTQGIQQQGYPEPGAYYNSGNEGYNLGSGSQQMVPPSQYQQQTHPSNNSNPLFHSNVNGNDLGRGDTGYQITAQNYSAYPEHDPEFNVQANRSYQHGGVDKGWNDPPANSKDIVAAAEVLNGIKSPESEIVSSISMILSSVKTRVNQGQQRMVDDTEKRMESLFELLGSGSTDKTVLAATYTIVKSITQKDYASARDGVTTLMSVQMDHVKWLVGLKRLIELSQQCG